MSTPHVIRLRGPWKCENCAGQIRYTRRFNLPTNLGPGERVWLVCQGLDEAAALALNGRGLGTLGGCSPPGRFDITEWLEPHNVLAIDCAADSATSADAFPGEVRLEIHPPNR
jgi:hypothetical protein